MQFNRGVEPLRVSAELDFAMVKFFSGEAIGGQFSIDGGCSGAFLTKRTILTAAHCFNKVGKYRSLLFRPNNLEGKNILARPGSFKTYIHPQFDRNDPAVSRNYDLALIVFERDVHEGPVVLIDALSLKDIVSAGPPRGKFYSFGGGGRNFHFLTPHREEKGDEYLAEGFVLATNTEGWSLRDDETLWLKTVRGVKVCEGDSGGAVVRELDGKLNLIGVNVVVAINHYQKATEHMRETMCSRYFQVSLVTPENLQWIINHYE